MWYYWLKLTNLYPPHQELIVSHSIPWINPIARLWDFHQTKTGKFITPLVMPGCIIRSTYCSVKHEIFLVLHQDCIVSGHRSKLEAVKDLLYSYCAEWDQQPRTVKQWNVNPHSIYIGSQHKLIWPPPTTQYPFFIHSNYY